MKFPATIAIAILAVSAQAFCPIAPSSTSTSTPSQLAAEHDHNLSRQGFVQSVSAAGAVFATISLVSPQPALARGRATLEQSYRRYHDRIISGGQFYNGDLRKLISSADFAGIKEALQEPPQRTKEDLVKSDAGVAARARQAGGFSDARVLTAADLYAAAFSDNSLTAKTKSMQGSVAKMRSIVNDMAATAKSALGEDTGGFFGFGAKKLSRDEASKQLKQLYVDGGNVWNQYVQAANDELPLQFERFPFIG